MSTQSAIANLTEKQDIIYRLLEESIDDIMQDNDWSKGGQTFCSKARNTNSVYFVFSYYNNSSELDFSVRVSDHLPNAGRLAQDINMNLNYNWTKQEIIELIQKFKIND